MDPTSLIVDFVIGSIGFVSFVYGRKMSRMPHVLVGIGLSALVIVPIPWFATAGVGAVLVVGLIVMVKMGL